MNARPPARIAGLILAAGRSSRMGTTNKLVAKVGGVPMVRRVASVLAEAGLDPIVVVLGYDAEGVRAALQGSPVRCVLNPDFASGIASSIRVGISALRERPDIDLGGALIALADMPWVTVATVRRLVTAFAPDAGRGICAPVAGQRRGNPVLWGARYFRELEALEGDVGARRLLQVYEDDLCEVRVSGSDVLRDIDTPDALEAARDAGLQPDLTLESGGEQ